MKITKNLAWLSLVAGSLISLPMAQANTSHGPADLVLTFQNPGGSTGASSTMIVALGDVLNFRDATPGSYTEILNIGSNLTSIFGGSWYDESTLWMGAVGFRGTSDSSLNLLPNQANGDPHRTIYGTAARNSIGTVGSVGSVITNIVNDGTMTSTVNAINAVKGNLENIGSNTLVGVVPTSTSFVDNQNPFLGGNIQQLAYTGFAGGVQDSFFVGSLGTFGLAGNIELALDLYRFQARNDIAGQYGFGDPVRQGEYLGTITINSLGAVGFTAAVPEPSTWALIGLGLITLIVFKRRKLAA